MTFKFNNTWLAVNYHTSNQTPASCQSTLTGWTENRNSTVTMDQLNKSPILPEDRVATRIKGTRALESVVLSESTTTGTKVWAVRSDSPVQPVRIASQLSNHEVPAHTTSAKCNQMLTCLKLRGQPSWTNTRVRPADSKPSTARVGKCKSARAQTTKVKVSLTTITIPRFLTVDSSTIENGKISLQKWLTVHHELCWLKSYM